MFYWSSKYEHLITFTNNKCSVCNEETNLKIYRKSCFFIAFLVIWLWWHGKIIGECSSCGATCKLDKKEIYDKLDNMNFPFKRDPLLNIIITYAIIFNILIGICML